MDIKCATPTEIKEVKEIIENKKLKEHVCECKHCNRTMNTSVNIVVQVEPVGRKFKNPAFSS